MKNFIKLKFIIPVLFFGVLHFNGIANETIRMTLQVMTPWVEIIATQGEQFTVDWGDGCIETYMGEGGDYSQFIGCHYLPDPSFCPTHIIITGSTPECKFSYIYATFIISFDASEAPSLKKIDLSNLTCEQFILQYANLSNCSLLENLSIIACSLKNIDLSDCISLRDLEVVWNKLSVLDVSNTRLEVFGCTYNCLPLSQLYPIYLKLPYPKWGDFYLQTLPTQTIVANHAVDFSSEKEFGGVPTAFYVYKGSEPALPDEYSIKDGIITFYSGGIYTVYMYNSVFVVPPPCRPPLIEVTVIVKAPVQEIINVPATAVAGTPLLLSGTVIPNDATNKTIIWSVKDTGATGVTISGNWFRTKTEGTAIITATIKNGCLDSNYVQHFTIEVKPLGVHDPAQELSKVTVYPNPATNELEIENGNLFIYKIEMRDMGGRMVLSQPFNILSAHHRIDVSNLNSGLYFVKIFTERGDVVQKVLKQ